MTTCPYCDDIRIVCVDKRIFGKAWHATCKCGNVWNWSSTCGSKREAKKNWEHFIQAFNQNQLRDSMRKEGGL